MGLIEQAKADIEEIVSDLDTGFGWAITLVKAITEETITLNGLYSKHHLGVDTDGNRINAKNAHISVAEGLLVAGNYPVRNAKNEVFLKGDKVTVTDISGVTFQYKISENYPSETTGLIVCLLEDFE